MIFSLKDIDSYAPKDDQISSNEKGSRK